MNRQKVTVYFFLFILLAFTLGVIASCSNPIYPDTADYREEVVTDTERGNVFKFVKKPQRI